MSNDVDPTEEIEWLGIRRTHEQMAAAGRIAREIDQEIHPKILMVDSHSTEARVIAEHLAFRHEENPDVIVVEDDYEWSARPRETAPTLDTEMLPKQLKGLDAVDPRVLEHRRYAARREQRQALTKNQLKARRRRGGGKGY